MGYGADPYGTTPFGGGGMLNPTISKDTAGDWWLNWTADPDAIAYDIVTAAGVHVQAGRKKDKAKLGKTKPSPLPKVASAHAGAYETAPDPDAPPPPPPPPPPPSGWEGWGFNTANAYQQVTPGGRRGELQRGWDVGARFPRIDGDRAEADLCRSIGFKKWIVILGGGKNFPYADNTISYLDAYPEAWAEPTNEINLGNAGWTPESHAAHQIAWYKAVKAKHPNATLLLASIGNSESAQNLTPIQWCQRLAAAGCKPGNGFDVANYHAYEQPMSWYKWRGPGSIQELFGNPRHVFSEWGRRSDSSEDDQATVVGKMMDWIREDPLCVGGHIYAIGDDAEGGPHGSAPYGWGLFRLDGSAKKAAGVFKARAAG